MCAITKGITKQMSSYNIWDQLYRLWVKHVGSVGSIACKLKSFDGLYTFDALYTCWLIETQESLRNMIHHIRQEARREKRRLRQIKRRLQKRLLAKERQKERKKRRNKTA